jgi:hypothetical protein
MADRREPYLGCFRVLRSEGLIKLVPHLVESPSLDSQPIHGLALDDAGELLEQELGLAADEAARRIIGEKRTAFAEQQGVAMLAPAYDTQPDVGIFRLTYRPQTELTADWYRRMQLQAEEWIPIYQRIGA